MTDTQLSLPPVADTDSDDVALALQTAHALWRRSDQHEAVRWLRRAAATAGDCGDDMRSVVLAAAAADLTSELGIPRSVMPGALPANGSGSSTSAAPVADASRDALTSPVALPESSTPVPTSVAPGSSPYAGGPGTDELTETTLVGDGFLHGGDLGEPSAVEASPGQHASAAPPPPPPFVAPATPVYVDATRPAAPAYVAPQPAYTAPIPPAPPPYVAPVAPAQTALAAAPYVAPIPAAAPAYVAPMAAAPAAIAYAAPAEPAAPAQAPVASPPLERDGAGNGGPQLASYQTLRVVVYPSDGDARLLTARVLGAGESAPPSAYEALLVALKHGERLI